MLYYKTRRNIKKEILFLLRYYSILFHSSKVREKEKTIKVDITKLSKNRYLYSFLKFFDLCGYTVFIPNNKKLLRELIEKKGQYTFMPNLLEEGFVKFGEPNKAINISFSAEQLSNDYFTPLFSKYNEKVYHVPICKFPTFYNIYHQIPNKESVKHNKRSVFMAGNIDPVNYQKIKFSGLFALPSRLDVAEYLYGNIAFRKLNSLIELNEFINSLEDEKIIIIDTSKDFRIRGGDLNFIYQSFNFYLALPGVDMPYCHNLIEAMSNSCIPIIHLSYAELMIPALEDNNTALVYENFEQLDEKIKFAFSLPEKGIIRMRENVEKYYSAYLSPEAVVNKLENDSFDKIYIQASYNSVKYLKEVNV
ncbi:hypothetical protein [Salegentibacter sp. UBA1130]|uniref:hypothetical protein n=1 Tax=Salegentibacter sp. UBA1130 TaxID=1947451 RepID=UPI00257C20B6|nr:hypothetical protein [Salegentibacter sp. UBA1130]